MNYGLDTSPVVMELASRVGRGDLFEWLEEQAQGLARLGRAADGTVRIGRALQRACRVTSVTPGRMSARAELRVDDDCFSIVFNPILSADVQRFSIAHEIGHTLWMEFVPGEAPRDRYTGVGHNRTIEMLCDYFAGALLMPRGDVENVLRFHRESRVKRRRSFEEEQCPLELVPMLAQRFCVQRQIAAWRLLLVQRLSSWAIVRAQDRFTKWSLPLLALERQRNEAWETAWYETGSVRRKRSIVEGYRVPFDTRRRIPIEMVPADLAAEALLQKLDSRWWDGVEPEPAASASRPFRRRQGKRDVLGLAARIGNSVYVAVDREARRHSSLERGGRPV